MLAQTLRRRTSLIARVPRSSRPSLPPRRASFLPTSWSSGPRPPASPHRLASSQDEDPAPRSRPCADPQPATRGLQHCSRCSTRAALTLPCRPHSRNTRSISSHDRRRRKRGRNWTYPKRLSRRGGVGARFSTCGWSGPARGAALGAAARAARGPANYPPGRLTHARGVRECLALTWSMRR